MVWNGMSSISAVYLGVLQPNGPKPVNGITPLHSTHSYKLSACRTLLSTTTTTITTRAQLATMID